MDRLTKRDRHGNPMPKELRGMGYGQWHEMVDVFERLAEYEDEEEQGFLIRFPVKVDDHLWEIYPPNDYEVREVVVNSVTNSKWESYTEIYIPSENCTEKIDLGQVGKTLFKTKEEAESARLEMCGG